MLRPAFSPLLMLLATLLSASTLLAQHPTRSLPSFGPALHAFTPQGGQPPFATSGYTYEFLNPATTPPSYMVFFKGTRTYQDGKLAEEISQSPDFVGGGTALVNQFRTTYAYNGTRLDQQTSYTWDATGSAWVPSSRESYTYDANGRATVMLSETFDAGAWQNDYRVTTTYGANGLPSQIEDASWIGGAWVPEERSTISESAGTVTVLDQTWTGSAWVNSGRTVYQRSLADLFAAQQAFEAAALTTALFLFVPPNREAAGFFYTLPYTSELWDSDADAWVNDMRVRVLTDTEAQVQTIEEGWDGSTSTWVATERTTVNFANDRVQDLLIETPNGVMLTAESKTVYTYDANGNATRVEFFSDDDQDGTLDTPAGSRLTLTYTDLATDTEQVEASAPTSRLTHVQPMPSNGVTSIAFTVGQTGPVLVRLFDALGREVVTLTDQSYVAGAHTVMFDASVLPSGVYMVRLESGSARSTRTLVVAR